MIARGFKSVAWVATVGAAALGCYMVSLRVATERNDLARVEREIAAAQRDIRTLKTELGTRGRLSQLEHWNAEVLALAAPASAQYMPDTLTLARLERREPTVQDRSAEVHMASAETAVPARRAASPAAPVVQAVGAGPATAPTGAVVHQASFTQMQPVKAAAKPKARPELPAPDAVKPAKAAPAAATASAAAKPAKAIPAPATATAAAKPSPAKAAPAASARLGAKLAQEIGAAARSEAKGDAGGGN